jgi:thiamine pyrophosphokinase
VSGRTADAPPPPGSPVVIFAGGDPSAAEHLADLPADALVVAADSGAVHAVAHGWPVHVLVGDLDSIPPGLTTELSGGGTVVHRHPPAKDQTDLALALDLACSSGAARVTVVGGHGGRLDHLWANLLLLGADRYAAVAVDARMGTTRVTIVRGSRSLSGEPGEVVSLLALGGAAEGVTTDGLLFPLSDATLEPGTSWGVSNEMTTGQATVTVRRGVLAAVQPGVRGVLSHRPQSDRP